jgi:threonine synthase
VQASFDAALKLVRDLGELPGVVLVNSINPFRLEGQKTAAFEIIEELGDSPARVFIPVGNAGNITAYWRGFREFQIKSAGRCPRMHGAQAKGAAPLVSGKAVARPRTVASAIRIGNPASWSSAIAARDESGGSIEAVTDDEILAAHRRLSAEEGLLAEPASAAGVALLIRKVAAGELDAAETIVCILTGQGLKDPKAMTRGLSMPPPVEPTLDAVRRAIN